VGAAKQAPVDALDRARWAALAGDIALAQNRNQEAHAAFTKAITEYQSIWTGRPKALLDVQAKLASLAN
jgi:predicted negative regulator of RcsB-dependent stress response